jgi:hypothetical protein
VGGSKGVVGSRIVDGVVGSRIVIGSKGVIA